jgi:hypothetical protein
LVTFACCLFQIITVLLDLHVSALVKQCIHLVQKYNTESLALGFFNKIPPRTLNYSSKVKKKEIKKH